MSASGDETGNEGQQRLPMVSSSGLVPEQCPSDAGNRVVVGRGGGVVQNLHTGEATLFIREHGMYLMDMWISLAHI